jgi:putative sterol carrier protein
MYMAGATSDVVTQFFGAIERQGHVPTLKRCTGTVRFDVADGPRVDHWRLEIAKGDITVLRSDEPADAVVRADRAVVAGMLRGDVNPVAATLRGVVVVEGDWDLVLLCQRIFGSAEFAPERREPEREEVVGG